MPKKAETENRHELIAAYESQWKESQTLAVDYEKQAYLVFSVGASLLSFGFTAINSLIKNKSLAVALLVILLTGAVTMIAWISTLFRRQALAENNAIRIEKRLNELLGENVFQWQSGYIEQYAVKPHTVGLPNTMIQITSCVLVGVLAIVCFLSMAMLLFGAKKLAWVDSMIVSRILVIVAALYSIFALFGLIKSFKNDDIRHGKKEDYLL